MMHEYYSMKKVIERVVVFISKILMCIYIYIYYIFFVVVLFVKFKKLQESYQKTIN